MENMYKMFETLEKGYVVFNKKRIRVIIDNDGETWFNAFDTADCFGYVRQQKAIQDLVDPINRVMLSNIDFDYSKQPDIHWGHPNSNYLPEGGLFQMILSSKLPVAKKINLWVSNTLLPSIRKYGYYALDKKYSAELKKCNSQVKYLTNERDKLIKDCEECNFPASGVIYAIDVSTKHQELYRIGSTCDLKNRKKTYNTHQLHNPEISYFLETPCCRNTERCAKGLLFDYRYVYDGKVKKDIYECSLDKIKYTFDYCAKGADCITQKGGSKTTNIIRYNQKFFNGKIKNITEKISDLEREIAHCRKYIVSKY